MYFFIFSGVLILWSFILTRVGEREQIIHIVCRKMYKNIQQLNSFSGRKWIYCPVNIQNYVQEKSKHQKQGKQHVR